MEAVRGFYRFQGRLYSILCSRRGLLRIEGVPYWLISIKERLFEGSVVYSVRGENCWEGVPRWLI